MDLSPGTLVRGEILDKLRTGSGAATDWLGWGAWDVRHPLDL